MNEINELSNKIKALHASTISVEDFHQWVTASSDMLSKTISQGTLLKLKRGDISKILSVSKTVLNACPKCSTLFKEKTFLDRIEHTACAAMVDEALKAGALRRISKPIWYNPASTQLGADAYFECVYCGSIWSLVEPERQFNGLWERIF